MISNRVFKVKRQADGSIERWKVRLVGPIVLPGAYGYSTRMTAGTLANLLQHLPNSFPILITKRPINQQSNLVSSIDLRTHCTQCAASFTTTNFTSPPISLSKKCNVAFGQVLSSSPASTTVLALIFP